VRLKESVAIIESLLPQMHKVDIVVINEDSIDNWIIG